MTESLFQDEFDATTHEMQIADDVMEWDCWSNSDPDDASQDE